MKKKIPVFDKDKEEKVWIKIRKLDTNFSLDEDNHRHTYEELIWVKSGDGTQLIDNERLTIQANTLYLISNGQIHNFIEGKQMEAYVIGFDHNFLKAYSPFPYATVSRLLDNFKTINALALKSPSLEELDIIVRQMHAEYAKPKKTIKKLEILNCFLLILLNIIQRELPTFQGQLEKVATDYKFPIYQEFQQLIDLNFTEQHSLSFYTDKLGISARNLTSCTKIYTGKSAKQLIIVRLTTEAKRLLAFTSLSLKEIATTLGFEETSYFIRLFRIQTSQTPGTYRENNQHKVSI